MKRLLLVLAALMLLFSCAFAEALPVETEAFEQEINAEITFEDVADTEVLVLGPLASREFIENYVREHPDIIWEAYQYLFYMDVAQYFSLMYPDAQDNNTYTVTENGYEEAEMDAGFCVSFHQNLAADDPFGGYTEVEYAYMIAIGMRELDAEMVYVGYFGNPEISFLCMDKEKAFRFAIQHNQNSVYCVSTDETPVNPKWDSTANPIRGVD